MFGDHPQEQHRGFAFSVMRLVPANRFFRYCRWIIGCVSACPVYSALLGGMEQSAPLRLLYCKTARSVNCSYELFLFSALVIFVPRQVVQCQRGLFRPSHSHWFRQSVTARQWSTHGANSIQYRSILGDFLTCSVPVTQKVVLIVGTFEIVFHDRCDCSK